MSRYMIMNPAAIDLSVLPSLPLECRSKLPPVACIYFAIDSMGQIQYVGRSANLRNRWTIHHRTNQLKQLEGVKIAWLEVSDPSLLPEIEAALINWFTPLLNGSNIQGTTNRFGFDTDTAKIVMPKALKRLFKTTCAQRDIEMSAVMTPLTEEWCLKNNKSITIAQLIEQNRLVIQTANLSDIDAIAAGLKPTKADLMKLAAALGVSLEFLQAICDRSHYPPNGER